MFPKLLLKVSSDNFIIAWLVHQKRVDLKRQDIRNNILIIDYMIHKTLPPEHNSKYAGYKVMDG